jgi:hypothetical protein
MMETMDTLIEHIHDTGINLPEDMTDYQLRILCEVVIRYCDEHVKASLWAEPGDLLDHFELDRLDRDEEDEE